MCVWVGVGVGVGVGVRACACGCVYAHVLCVCVHVYVHMRVCTYIACMCACEYTPFSYDTAIIAVSFTRRNRPVPGAGCQEKETEGTRSCGGQDADQEESHDGEIGRWRLLSCTSSGS